MTPGIVNVTVSRLYRLWNRHVVKGGVSCLHQFRSEGRPKVYIYDLPKKFKPTHELPLVSETYFALDDFIRRFLRTDDPRKADYFFVPLNIIEYQFRNENPADVLHYLKYYNATQKNHILIALGDYSQRSKKNHFGFAYRDNYTWINDFILLALESTSDLTPNQDIGIIPFNTLSTDPVFNHNARPFLYSFLGQTTHQYLPSTHIRNRMKSIPIQKDTLITSKLTKRQKNDLKKNYITKNDYELLARNSVFTLAPAGFGRWTYRFFQAIQWGSIPVLLSDDYIKPFGSVIPYDTFCITIPEKEVLSIDSILRSITPSEVKKLQNALEANQHHFTRKAFFEMLCDQLIIRKCQHELISLLVSEKERRC
jgi:hypothetical protein